MNAARNLPLPLIALALAGPAIALTLIVIEPGLVALRTPAAGFDLDRLVLLYSDLPRLATALIAGAALGLSGVLLQQVLRNPLASPTTLGLSAGANLALALAMLYAPGLLAFGRDPIALAGSVGAGLVVLGLSVRRGFAPVARVVAGAGLLMVSSVRYRSVKEFQSGRVRFKVLLGVIVAFAIVFLDPPLVLLTVAVVYVAVGLLLSLWGMRKGKPAA